MHLFVNQAGPALTASGVSISVSASIVRLLEGDYELDHAVVSFALGAAPDFEKAQNRDKLEEQPELDGCVVKLELSYDAQLDVEASPVLLCWTQWSWAEPRNVTLSVRNNERVDDEDPRTRYLQVSRLLSIDDSYSALSLQSMRVMVLVNDDEYCDPDICQRGDAGEAVAQSATEYDDHFQDVEVGE